MRKDVHFSAFISYRHVEPDITIARKLHSMIENYKIPRAVKKATGISKPGRVFRDKDELPLSTDLGGDIKQALKNSDWLIIICSKAYLESRWCAEELKIFIEEGKKDKILIVSASGTPEESFPRELLYREINGVTVPVEPLAAVVAAKDIKASLKRLKTEKLRILAPMLGVSFDELKRRTQRRAAKIRLAAILGAFVLISAFALFALNRARVIENERTRAAGNEVQLLCEKSLALTNQNDRRSAIGYALEAIEVSDTINGAYRDEAFDALSAACYSADFTRIMTLSSGGMRVYSTVYSADDSLIAGIANYDTLIVFDAVTGNELYTRCDTNQPLTSVSFSPGGKHVMAVSNYANEINVYTAREGGEVALLKETGHDTMGYVTGAYFITDDLIAIVDRESVTLFNLESMQTQAYYTFPWTWNIDERYSAISPEAMLVAVFDCYGGGQVGIIDLETGETRTFETGLNYGILGGVFSPDGKYIAVSAAGNTVLFDIQSGEALWTHTTDTTYFVTDMKFTSDGSVLIAAADGIIEGFDAIGGEIKYSVNIDCSVSGGTIELLCGEGSFCFTDYPSVIFDTQSGAKLRDLTAEGLTFACAAHTRNELLMGGDGTALTVNNSLRTGSIELKEHFEGEIFTVSNYGALKRDTTLYNSYYDSSVNSFVQSRMYVSPDGRFAVYANDGTYIKIWDLDVSDDVLYRLYEHSYSSTITYDLAFSADSRLCATAGYDGRSAVFDLINGKTLIVLSPCSGRCALGGVKFNPDASLIMLSTETTGEYFVYSVSDGTLLYHLYADGEVEDFGFDTLNGNAVIKYTDGGALVATIFSDEDTLMSYAAEING